MSAVALRWSLRWLRIKRNILPRMFSRNGVSGTIPLLTSRPCEPMWHAPFLLEHVAATPSCFRQHNSYQQVQLDISKDVVRLGEPVKLDAAPIDLDLPPPRRPWCQLPSLQIPEKAVRWYGDTIVRRIVSWFWQTAFDSVAEPVWVSHYQLYADYMCCTGHPGPVNINGWIDGERLSHLYLRGIAFRTRARWFAKVWRETLRHQGIILESAYGRPCSQVILLHTGCVSLPWPRDRLENVDRWMFACSQTAFKRQSAAIDSLPFASIQPGFPPCFQTTAGAWTPKMGSIRTQCCAQQKSEKSGGFKHGFYFPYMGCHPSHWRTPSFFKIVF